LDLIGKISPPYSNEYTFIITAIDYFTKWIGVIPLHSITINVICHFILEHIISLFIFPSTLVLENGIPFNNDGMKKLLETFNIQNYFSTPYYPQSNGQFESTNKT
jgi:hypothetical protein